LRLRLHPPAPVCRMPSVHSQASADQTDRLVRAEGVQPQREPCLVLMVVAEHRCADNRLRRGHTLNALAPIAGKLGKLIRLLSSDKDGEVLGAVHAIRRTLQTEKLDIHALADGLTGINGHNGGERKYTENDMRTAYRSGRDDGRKEAESNGGFHSID